MIYLLHHFGYPNPIKSLSPLRLFKLLARTSAAIMNRVGGPLKEKKNPKKLPLNTTEYHLFETNLHTKSIILSKNPNFLITFVKKIQDTLSYAFVMSNLTIILWDLFLLFMSLMISWERNTL